MSLNWYNTSSGCSHRNFGVGQGLSQIGLEPLEDLPSLEIEEAQPDRPRGPICFNRLADRAGRVSGFNFAFGEDSRTEIAGDTATDYDTTGHFLVLCEGDFDQEAVSEAQLHGAALAFAWAAQNFRIASDTLAGHRDLAQTSCPGANLYAHVSSGDLKLRIDDLLAAGTVDLRSVCGPEAAAKVAAIEEGH